MGLRKPAPGEMYGPPAVPFSDAEFQRKYPSITEYLFTQKWQDGSPRVTSTLAIFSSEGALKVVLNDRDNNRSAFFCEPTVELALESLEQALSTDRVDWKTKPGMASDKMKTPF